MHYQPQSTSGDAIAALVLGICGFVVCPLVCSILAIVYAQKAKRDIRASGGRVGGDAYATAGLILGWVGVGICVLTVMAFVAMFVFAIGVATTA
jgi:Domain of unknown function (DUF4190)